MADVALSITVPDANVARVVAALNAGADKPFILEIQTAGGGGRTAQYPAKDAGETTAQFAARVLRWLIKNFIYAIEINSDIDRYTQQTGAIVAPAANVPEDIVT
ncbi:hypothetical protein EH223_08465 [candidate division KSB1 bacterium]|nr:MAG: hypothetical protein EH223_08465 [candidate division KSB1 bacterium]